MIDIHKTESNHSKLTITKETTRLKIGKDFDYNNYDKLIEFVSRIKTEVGSPQLSLRGMFLFNDINWFIMLMVGSRKNRRRFKSFTMEN